MNTLKKQNGLTMWGWLVVLVMVGFIGMQVFALMVPAVNYNTAQTIIADLETDQSLKGQPVALIKSAVMKKMSFNGVNDFDVKNKDVFKAEKTKKGVKVVVSYEQRAPLFGPLSMILALNKEVLIGKD